LWQNKSDLKKSAFLGQVSSEQEGT